MFYRDAIRAFDALMGEVAAGDKQKKTGWMSQAWHRRLTWLRWLRELKSYAEERESMALAHHIQSERLKLALNQILWSTRDQCEHSTTGIGSCFRQGKVPDAYYGADRCCNSCIAYVALNPCVSVSVSTEQQSVERTGAQRNDQTPHFAPPDAPREVRDEREPMIGVEPQPGLCNARDYRGVLCVKVAGHEAPEHRSVAIGGLVSEWLSPPDERYKYRFGELGVGDVFTFDHDSDGVPYRKVSQREYERANPVIKRIGSTTAPVTLVGTGNQAAPPALAPVPSEAHKENSHFAPPPPPRDETG